MAKYDIQLAEVKNHLNISKKVLVVLPNQVTIDKLAAGLALYLSLKQSGKDSTIVTEDTLKVVHGNLYGVGEVKNQLESVGGGNYVITLDGVVEPNGQIPALEKLDWYPEGSNLNLVFHVISGQRFEPKNIKTQFQGGGFDLIFVIGAANLSELGNIYQQQSQIFATLPIINVDHNPSNANFGKYNIVDPNAACITEMIAQILPGLSLLADADISSNILTGIYDATQNLTYNVKPDTFTVVGMAMQSGGRIPQITTSVQATPQQPQANSGFDLRQVFQAPISVAPQSAPPAAENFTNPTIVNSAQSSQPPQPSQEERPTGEFATSSSPETLSPAPDWLTPKIYKGSSIG